MILKEEVLKLVESSYKQWQLDTIETTIEALKALMEHGVAILTIPEYIKMLESTKEIVNKQK